MVATRGSIPPKLPDDKDRWRTTYKQLYIALANAGRFLEHLTGIPDPNHPGAFIPVPEPAAPEPLTAFNSGIVREMRELRDRYFQAKANAWAFIIQIANESIHSAIIGPFLATMDARQAWSAIIEFYEMGAYEDHQASIHRRFHEIKLKSSGNLETDVRARLTAKGCSQIPDADFDETFHQSLVLQLSGLFLLLVVIIV